MFKSLRDRFRRAGKQAEAEIEPQSSQPPRCASTSPGAAASASQPSGGSKYITPSPAMWKR